MLYRIFSILPLSLCFRIENEIVFFRESGKRINLKIFAKKDKVKEKGRSYL